MLENHFSFIIVQLRRENHSAPLRKIDPEFRWISRKNKRRKIFGFLTCLKIGPDQKWKILMRLCIGEANKIFARMNALPLSFERNDFFQRRGKIRIQRIHHDFDLIGWIGKPLAELLLRKFRNSDQNFRFFRKSSQKQLIIRLFREISKVKMIQIVNGGDPWAGGIREA